MYKSVVLYYRCANFKLIQAARTKVFLLAGIAG